MESISYECEKINFSFQNVYAYENMSFLEEQERYSSQGLDYHPSDKGSCSNFNMLSVDCIRYPDKCKQFAEECIKLATGGQDNKYYHTAVVSVRDPRLVIVDYSMNFGSNDSFVDPQSYPFSYSWLQYYIWLGPFGH